MFEVLLSCSRLGEALNEHPRNLTPDFDSGKYITRYIIYTAYSATSATLKGGSCSTGSGTRLFLPTPFSVAVPISLNPVYYLSSANHKFVDFLGFSSCNGGGDNAEPTVLSFLSGGDVSIAFTSENITTPSASATISISSGATTFLTTSTKSFSSTAAAGSTNVAPTSTSPALVTSSNGLSKASRIAIGVVIPIACIALAAIIAFILIRYRNGKRRAVLNEKNGENDGQKTDSSSPYFQNKAELEDEERRKHELEANGVRYEMSAEETIHEAPTGGHSSSSRAQNQQELGEEGFSKELATDGPNKVGRSG